MTENALGFGRSEEKGPQRDDDLRLAHTNEVPSYLSLASLPSAAGCISPSELEANLSSQTPQVSIDTTQLEEDLTRARGRVEITNNIAQLFEQHIAAQKEGKESDAGEYQTEKNWDDYLGIRLIGFSIGAAVGLLTKHPLLAGWISYTLIGILAYHLDSVPEPEPYKREFKELRDKIEAAVGKNNLGPEARLALYQDGLERYRSQYLSAQVTQQLLERELAERRRQDEDRKKIEAAVAAQEALRNARNELGFTQPKA